MVKLSEAISYSKHYNDGTDNFNTIVKDGSTSPFFLKPSDASSLKNWDGYYYVGEETLDCVPIRLTFGKDSGVRGVTITLGKYKYQGDKRVDSIKIPTVDQEITAEIAEFRVPEPTSGTKPTFKNFTGNLKTDSTGQCILIIEWNGLGTAVYPKGTSLHYKLVIAGNLKTINVTIKVNVDMYDIDINGDDKPPIEDDKPPIIDDEIIK